MSWQDALEMHMELHRFHLLPHGKRYLSSLWEGIYQHRIADEAMDEMVSRLWRADTFYVTSDMQKVIEAAADSIPEDIELHFEEILVPSCVCIFEEAYVYHEKRGKKIAMKGFFWAFERVGDVWSGAVQFLSDSMDPRDCGYDLRESTYPELAEKGLWLPRLNIVHAIALGSSMTTPFAKFSERVISEEAGYTAFEKEIAYATLRMLKIWYALQLIAQQRIVSKEEQRPPRASRKRAEKWDPQSDRYISLITLRHTKKTTDEPQAVDWHHRWVVTGHWRKQWYPSLQKHQWVFIHEYVKGPEDKPLLIRERRVFNLRR